MVNNQWLSSDTDDADNENILELILNHQIYEIDDSF